MVCAGIEGYINPVGTLSVVAGEGSTKFRSPQTEGSENLDFDPRGKWVEVYEGTTRIFDVLFPE